MACSNKLWPYIERVIAFQIWFALVIWLALRLSSGKIIRLHISTMATGCYLYATYSKELEERINLWMALKKKDAMKVAIDYALEWNRLQTEAAIKAQEIAI